MKPHSVSEIQRNANLLFLVHESKILKEFSSVEIYTLNTGCTKKVQNIENDSLFYC